MIEAFLCGVFLRYNHRMKEDHKNLWPDEYGRLVNGGAYMETVYIKEKNAVIQAAKEKIEAMLKEAIAAGKDVLFLVSGGSNIELLKQVDPQLLKNSKITVFPLDERYDRGDQNNSLLMKKEGIPIVTMVPVEIESLEAFGQRYHQFLADWIEKHPHGVIYAIIGIGPDGHTAGISPGDQEWFDETFVNISPGKHAVGYKGNLNPPERVTVTPEFLRERVDEGVVVATGDGKREALIRMLSGAQNLGETPARVLAQANGKMTLYTDVQLAA